jgi:hypothetical protein
MKLRTKQIIKYVLMLERLPLKGDTYFEIAQDIKEKRQKFNILREKLLMPESRYPYKQA